MDDVFPIGRAEALRAKDIVLGHPSLSARDAIHLAVMEAQEIETILSFDRHFDGFPGVRRMG